MEYPITAGQIVLPGDSHKKLNPLKTDYLLRYSESLRLCDPKGLTPPNNSLKLTGRDSPARNEFQPDPASIRRNPVWFADR